MCVHLQSYFPQMEQFLGIRTTIYVRYMLTDCVENIQQVRNCYRIDNRAYDARTRECEWKQNHRKVFKKPNGKYQIPNQGMLKLFDTTKTSLRVTGAH